MKRIISICTAAGIVACAPAAQTDKGLVPESQTLHWRQLLDFGVASFATDHPEVTLKAVSDYYAAAQP